ncbi:hypothetical protein [Futiania mangrovi]|uniref:Secreted protein n=1 Tax=Futiania mangrovi TaxID=2959716 RepID=A0A9J6PJD7_9PROT|nr:hypothetical protein [Futiania mangrovii]MCP1337891.1 hypothetical protein [Futiania mangrovii]
MVHRIRLAAVLATTGLLSGIGTAASADGVEDRIAEALSAAPPGIRETATVSDLDGTVLRPGDGAYTCFPAPEKVAGPMCMDGEWMRWMDAWSGGKPFQAGRVGIAYMLAGDAPNGGASNVDPAASQPTTKNDWVVEGPHLMVIVPDNATLEGLPTTPDTDGPYVMWPGTPYAHIMVPVAERPAQRQAEGG